MDQFAEPLGYGESGTSDIYKEGYDKGYQDGRVAGIGEMADWIEKHPRWVESGIVSEFQLKLAKWREHPEAPFERW